MKLRTLVAAGGLIGVICLTVAAFAQTSGGILHADHFDSPASMSMLEESTLAANRPTMSVFNNLVMFDQQVAQNSPASIVSDLAMRWAWNEEGTELTMSLGSPDRQREREAPHQPAQILVRQSRYCDHKR